MINGIFPLGRRWAIAALAVLVFSAAAAAEPRPSRAAIATAHPLATAAGMEVLEKGGNAFDAAVAISAALAVVEPNGSGLGGGAFWLMHRAADGLDVMVDGREVAPGAASRDMYLDAAGNPIPRASMDGPLAAGIPGQPAGLAHITDKYGNLSLAENSRTRDQDCARRFPAVSAVARRFAVQGAIAEALAGRGRGVPAGRRTA